MSLCPCLLAPRALHWTPAPECPRPPSPCAQAHDGCGSWPSCRCQLNTVNTNISVSQVHFCSFSRIPHLRESTYVPPFRPSTHPKNAYGDLRLNYLPIPRACSGMIMSSFNYIAHQPMANFICTDRCTDIWEHKPGRYGQFTMDTEVSSISFSAVSMVL